jgi:hypothetical protein
MTPMEAMEVVEAEVVEAEVVAEMETETEVTEKNRRTNHLRLIAVKQIRLQKWVRIGYSRVDIAPLRKLASGVDKQDAGPSTNTQVLSILGWNQKELNYIFATWR